MHEMAKQFAEYCDRTFDVNSHSDYGYQSLSVCILDCVYSLRAKYYAITIPVVDRYAAAFMNGNRLADGDTVSMLIDRMDTYGLDKFRDVILKNHQVLGGANRIPKEKVCYQLAKYLQALHIETIEDFQRFESREILEIVVRAVNGLGDAGVNYLFMLAGDPNRCKPDVHIHHCIRDALGYDVSNEECQELFTEATLLLSNKYPYLTVRGLDGVVWRNYQIGNRR